KDMTVPASGVADVRSKKFDAEICHRMSAIGTKRTCQSRYASSELNLRRAHQQHIAIANDRNFAWQQPPRPNVRFGSKADITALVINVRFTPKSGHRIARLTCPLCANSGHSVADLGIKFIGADGRDS